MGCFKTSKSLSACLQPLPLRYLSHAATAAIADLSNRVQAAVTSSVAQNLSCQGFAVIDNIFGTEITATLRHELVALKQSGGMHLNRTHLVDAEHATKFLEKSRIYEAELSLDPCVRAAAPLCAALNSDHTLATLLSLFIPKLTLDSQAIKLQFNAGNGACFPMHMDSDETLDTRRITAVFYLNPGWSPSDGGQLRLYPFPSRPVDIEPLSDRLVLFPSTRMMHRVLPTYAERCCFTIWLSQSRRRGQPVYRRGEPLPLLTGQDAAPAATLQSLMQPSMWKHVLKLVYADEWEESLWQSHPDSVARTTLLSQHRAEVTLIQKALARYIPLIRQLAEHRTEDAELMGSLQMEWL